MANSLAQFAGLETDGFLRREPDEIGAVGQHLGRLDVPHKPNPLKAFEHKPARIGLFRIESKPRRCWKGVMVVVPSLPHGDDSAIADIVALHACALDVPGTPAAIMGEIANEPMSRNGGGDPRRNAPDHP